ncbi:MAG: Y-family DNA polymerase [Prevotellaceae bacterium]|nr:Y-family DNA polymerase [Prevotellaceae bacterium]
MTGLVDCNNFYASCERVFNPDLRGKPVVVLSNNDGCIIARSNEAKALGLKMGTPFYQAKPLLEQLGVAVFSSNYNLYGDMSRRVMMLLQEMTPGITQYSIDECFIDLAGIDDLAAFGRRVVQAVERGTGIPVTLGVAPTKTLAKIASKFGKRYKGYEGVCIIDTEEKREKALRQTEIGDVWGIGRHSVEKLRYHGVETAWDLTVKPRPWVRRMLTLTGERTWQELRGTPAIDVEELPQKQSICTSRSFPGQGLDDLAPLVEAVANFAAACVRKLRAQRSCCRALTVFAYTSPFRNDRPAHLVNRTLQLSVATNGLQEIVAAATRALREDYREGCLYKKAGVIVWNLCGQESVQGDLFDTVDRARQARLAKAIDAINRKNGHNTVRVASQGTDKRWHLKAEHITRQYTTNLKEVIKVRADR